MQVVTASNVSQLHLHLRNAFNNQQDYEITLTAATYVLTFAESDSPSTNPGPSFPYGTAGAQRSHLPQIRTRVTIKAAASCMRGMVGQSTSHVHR